MTGLGVTDGRWRTYSQGKKYQRDDKTYITDQWELIGSEWYYFGQEIFQNYLIDIRLLSY